MNRAIAVLLAFGFLAAPVCFGQGPTTGTPPFGSFGGGTFDTINLGNLNVYFVVPMLNKAGRGMPFSYSLSYDSSIWYPVGSVGSQAWTPTFNWGWMAQTAVHTGYVSYTFRLVNCDTQGEQYRVWDNFVYIDPWGTSHTYPAGLGHQLIYDPYDCINGGVFNYAAGANDGSGLNISVSITTNGSLNQSKVIARNGNVYNPPYYGSGSATATDANGNQIKASNGVFTDTLGTTALTVSGSAPNPTKFTYTSPSGSTYYQMNYVNYTVATNFGVSGISEYPKIANNLVDNIQLPDGTEYKFTYEKTPGSCTPLSGTYSGYCVTVRIASVTLPTGGQISYSYSGGKNGIESDGSTAGLSRTTPDSSTPWTYSRSQSGSAWVTTVKDPLGDKTVINFSKDSSTSLPTNNFYETQRVTYQGASTVLLTTTHCYNNNLTSCSTQSVSSPITQVDGYLQWPNGQQSHSKTLYDSVSGLMTADTEYDYGGAKLRYTTFVYSYLGSSVGYRPTCVQVTAGTVPSSCGTITSDTVSATTYSNYDSAGNVKTVSQWASGVTAPKWLSSGFTHTTGGLVQTVTDVNGAQTTYTYAANNNCPANSFPSSVAEPLGLSRSMTWDCNGGVASTATDENQKQTTYSYDLMWRMSNIQFPDGGEITTSYNISSTPPNITVSQLIDSSSHWVTTQTNLDGLGRAIQSATTDPNSTNSNGNRLANTTYNAVGQVGSVTNPYFITGDSTYGVTYYTYDALGSLRTAQLPDNNVLTYLYTDRAVQLSGVTGLNRVYQVDGLGRTVYVCDGINATQQADSANPSNCNLDAGATGFKATYQYDPRGLLTSASYSGESRSFSYDGLGRITSSSNPETGNESWTYDTASGGMLYQHTDARNIVATYSFDSLKRPTQISYSDGTTPTYNYYYDTQQGGGTGTNLKSRLALTKTTSPSSAILAESWFGYDTMGRVNNIGSCAPLVCPVNGAAWSILGFTFNYDGSLATLSDPDVPDTLTYTRNSIGQLTGLTSSLHNTNLPQTLVSNVKYNPFGAIASDTSVDGYAEAAAYNNMGRRTSFSAGSLYSFSLGYTSAGSVNSVTDSQMGSWTFGYDPYFFGRLTSATCSANCPNGWGGLSWTYDEYGNRWKQIVTAGQGPQPSYSFDTHNHITGSGVVYDNAGNMKSDGLGDTYTYDANSRTLGQQGFKYVVDALGNRVASTNLSSGVETDYVYSGSTLVHRNDASANGWGFESGFGIYYGNNSSHFYRNYTDQVATERVQTQYSTSGSMVYETCENLPFGDAFPCQHPQGGYGGDVYYFAGLFTDPGANGNDNHAVAREYSGTQGRWESSDPAGLAAADPSNPQTWNRYAYVMNNPLSFVDPLGLSCEDPTDGSPCVVQVTAPPARRLHLG